LKGRKERRGINWVNWLIPLIALGISIGMVLKYYQKEGLWVEVSFRDVQGITPLQTPVKYKGVEVGKVEEVEIDKRDLNRFILRLLIYPQYEYLVKKGTLFWKATLEISPDKIANLDTILKGSYIALLPPTTDRQELEKLPTELYFIGLEHPPGEKGYHFTLISNSGDLGKEAPIVYKGVQVGKLYSKRLGKDGKLRYQGLIFEKYQYLLFKNLKFYRIDPVKFKASLDSIQLRVPSLRLLLTGGVGIYIGDGTGTPKEEYILYSDLEDIQYAPQVIKLITTSKLPLSKVVYNNIVAGKVVSSEYDLKRDLKILRVKFKKEFFHLLKKSPYFYIQHPSLSLQNLNLKKLLSGAYIQMGLKGIEAPIKKSYRLMEIPPEKRGYHFRLRLVGEPKVSAGEGIYYRGIKVGEIQKVELEGRGLKVTGKIYNRYKYLINDSTLFYPISAVELEASLSKISLQVPPVAQLLKGGITFITPANRPLKKGEFPLFSSLSDLKGWLKLHRDGAVVQLTAPSPAGVGKGTPIYFRGFKAGEVLGVKWDPQLGAATIEAFIGKNFLPYLNSSTIFYRQQQIRASLSLSGVKVAVPPVEGLLKGAIGMEGNRSLFSPVERYPLLSWEEYQNRNFFNIYIVAKKSYGVKVGAPLEYNGVKIGEVSKIELIPEGGEVLFQLKIPVKFKRYFRTGTKIYLTQFQASITGVRNGGALLTGGIFKLLPSKVGKPVRYFSLDSINPPPTYYQKGVRFTLHTPGTQSIGVGAPLYYRYIPIGKVERVELAKGGEGVDLEIFVPEKYRYLIRKGDRFAYFHPVKVESHFLNFKVEVGTLPTILLGGIQLKEVNFSAPTLSTGEFWLTEE
jgi:paraquat-inducible protein B